MYKMMIISGLVKKYSFVNAYKRLQTITYVCKR